MSDEKIISQSIKGADIRVVELPAEYYPDQVKPENDKLNCIFINQEILKTPQGRPITHQQRSPLRELVSELRFVDSLESNDLSLYSLCSRQIDSVDDTQEILTQDYFSKKLLNDSLLAAITDREFNEKAMGRWQTMWSLISHVCFPSQHISEIPSGKIGTAFDENLFSKQQKKVFTQLSKSIYSTFQKFNLYEQTVFRASLETYNSILFSNLICQERVSPNMLADIYLGVNGIIELHPGGPDIKDYQDLFEKIKNSADCMRRYLEFFPPQLSEVELMIQKGESIKLEFKSTLRYSLKAGINDPAIGHAVLKTMVAYLNTDGGTLLVGVEDNGNILGIEPDHFENEDKYLLHFSALIKDRIGQNFSDLIAYELVPVKGNKVLFVQCKKSPTPAFVNTDNKQEFFIRTGPSSVQLNFTQFLNYAKRRFNL